MILARITRAIRQQNWFAVALEFVIVIAGVVIGFQVTAWNEVRSERVLEQRYLERLIESAAADAVNFQDAADLATQRGEQARQILVALDDPAQASAYPDAFLLSVITAAYTYTPTVDRVAFDEMISRGHIGLIRNEDVRSQIATYYQDLENRSQWAYMREHVQTRYMTLRAGVLTPAQERLQSQERPTSQFSADDVEMAIARIADRPDMIAWLPTVEFWQQYNEDAYTFATATAHDLQATLEAELERFAMILSRLSRAIRQQNWFAVALEFVIVIAGVLVAFQISAWNEVRQEQVRETGYIRDFKADVEADLAEIRQSLFFTRLRIAATNRILELAFDEPATWTLYESPGFADLPPAPLPDNLADDALLLAATATRTIDPANGTWEMLQSTGDVAIMRDRELVSAIQSYRAHLISVVDLELFARGFLPGIDAERRAHGIGLGQAIPRETLIELIQSHPDLAAGLRTMKTFALVQYEELIELEAAALSLIEDLDRQIQQRG